MYFGTLKLHSKFSRKCPYRFFFNVAIAKITRSSRESKIPTLYLQNYPWWQVIWSHVKWLMALFRGYGNSHLREMYRVWNCYLSSRPVKFDFLLDWFWRCSSRSKSNDIASQKPNRATLKELSHGILSYFEHWQNSCQIEGDLKIILYKDRKTPKKL